MIGDLDDSDDGGSDGLDFTLVHLRHIFHLDIYPNWISLERLPMLNVHACIFVVHSGGLSV